MSDRLAHDMYYRHRTAKRNKALVEAQNIQDTVNQLVYYIEGGMSPATLSGTARRVLSDVADLYALLAELDQTHELEYLTDGTVDE